MDPKPCSCEFLINRPILDQLFYVTQGASERFSFRLNSFNVGVWPVTGNKQTHIYNIQYTCIQTYIITNQTLCFYLLYIYNKALCSFMAEFF